MERRAGWTLNVPLKSDKARSNYSRISISIIYLLWSSQRVELPKNFNLRTLAAHSGHAECFNIFFTSPWEKNLLNRSWNMFCGWQLAQHFTEATLWAGERGNDVEFMPRQLIHSKNGCWNVHSINYVR